MVRRVGIQRVWWLLQSAVEVPADDAWLTKRERGALAALRIDKRKRDWRLGRWTAKAAVVAILSELRSTAPRAGLEIRASADGSPAAFLGNGPFSRPISLSHSHGLSLCVVGRAGDAVGCDLELIEPRSPRFVEDYFTAGERRRVAAASKSAGPLVATLIWSAKESALKASRQGLTRDTRSVEVRFDDGVRQAGSWRPLVVDETSERRSFSGWWCQRGAHILTLVGSPPTSVPAALSAPPGWHLVPTVELGR